MASLGTILKYPDDIYPLLKMKRAIENAEKQIPPEPHWGFCYSMLHKVSRSFSLVIQQLNTELRNTVSLILLRIQQEEGNCVEVLVTELKKRGMVIDRVVGLAYEFLKVRQLGLLFPKDLASAQKLIAEGLIFVNFKRLDRFPSSSVVGIDISPLD